MSTNVNCRYRQSCFSIVGEAIYQVFNYVRSIPLKKTVVVAMLAAVVLNNHPVNYQKNIATHPRVNGLDFIKNCPFLAQHGDELVYGNLADITGDWQRVSGGYIKTVYCHPGLPNYVFKVIGHRYDPNTSYDNYTEEYLRNVKSAREIIDKMKFQHLVVPNTFLIAELNNKKINILIEERFHFYPGGYGAIRIRMEKDPEFKNRIIAYMKELDQFVALCPDCAYVQFRGNWNAELLEDGSKIAIYDLDGF